MDDSTWMQHAINLAKQAEAQGEVPVGALIISEQQQLLAEGFNCPIAHHDPTAHAEVIAIRKAANIAANYRLINCTLYVTLEPCVMCIGAMIHARIKRLVFGAFDPKAGAVGSTLNILEYSHFNHRIAYQGNVLAEECGSLLKQFFQNRRK